jgi:hypothetical protein
MKRIALVTGHFAPSNLVGGQRARLWSQYLPEFGWEPIIVTGDPAMYEEKPDPDLELLVPKGLRVIHAPTYSNRPIRLVGDIGVRAFLGCYRVLADLACKGEVDFIVITIPSNFLACVGRLIHRRYGIPFGIDYIDPWVHVWPGVEKVFSRAWGAHHLGNILEPWAVKGISLVTGMSPGYAGGMLERNPEVEKTAVVASMPMGGAAEDFNVVRGLHRPTFLFKQGDGRINLIYAGALLPKGFGVLDAFLSGLGALRETAPKLAEQLCAHFVGTGTSPDDPNGYQVLPRAERLGVAQMVNEHPHRIGYVDTLNHLMQSNAILVLGSTEPHYTPSKVFQGILSRRPIFGILHKDSTAVDMVHRARAGQVLTLTETELPTAAQVAASLKSLLEGNTYDAAAVDWEAFEAYTARESTRLFVEALDRAYARSRGAAAT